jgi:hypothetical protein
LETGKKDAFITAIIDFEIAPDRLGASLSLENPARETQFLALTVPTPLNGEAAIRFGGTEQSAGYKQGTKQPKFDENGNPRNGTVILNELTLSYARLPLHKDERVTTDNLDGTKLTGLPAGPELPGEPSLSVR